MLLSSPGRSTSVKPHYGPQGPLHVPTPHPHTQGGAGPQISKLLSETQPSRGLRAGGWPPPPIPAWSRIPAPSTRVQGPGPSRGTRLGLISGPAPSPNGLQLHKHSQNSEPALSGVAQASAPAFLAPSPTSLGQLLRNSGNWLGIESQLGFSRGGGHWNGWSRGWAGVGRRGDGKR